MAEKMTYIISPGLTGTPRRNAGGVPCSNYLITFQGRPGAEHRDKKPLGPFPTSLLSFRARRCGPCTITWTFAVP